MDKLFKVYAVEGKYPIYKPRRSMFGELSDRIYGISPNIYAWETVAIFSSKKEAEKFIDEGVFPFDNEVKEKRVGDWRVDYELHWKEWNKLEEQNKGGGR